VKITASIIIFILSICLTPTNGSAATVYETTGTIVGTQGFHFEFAADFQPTTYRATLTNLSVAPLGFDFLGLFVSTATQNLVQLTTAGSDDFNVVQGMTYFGNVVGVASDPYSVGLFGVKIEAVPIPQSLMLLASGLIALIWIRRRVQ